MNQEKAEKDSHPNVIHEEWNIDEVADQASLQSKDEMKRQVRRGDETKGDPDERDVASVVESRDTPHGREETKTDREGVANRNG